VVVSDVLKIENSNYFHFFRYTYSKCYNFGKKLIIIESSALIFAPATVPK